HDNLFVDAGSAQNAITFQNHNGNLVQTYMYNNTIYGGNRGIYFLNNPTSGGGLMQNLIFASTPMSPSPPPVMASDNIGDAVANPGSYFNNPSFTLGNMDFYPKTTCPGCKGTSFIYSSPVASNVDLDKDFDGTSKGLFVFKGAYSDEGKYAL